MIPATLETFRLVITGGSRTGKTTLQNALAGMFGWALSTDDLIDDYEWGEVSMVVADLMLEPGPWIIEGVAAVRALRNYCERKLGPKPCDGVIYLESPLVELEPGQEAMRKGCRTIWEETRPMLEAAGVQIVEWPDVGMIEARARLQKMLAAVGGGP